MPLLLLLEPIKPGENVVIRVPVPRLDLSFAMPARLRSLRSSLERGRRAIMFFAGHGSSLKSVAAQRPGLRSTKR
jgi:hypothetical protein